MIVKWVNKIFLPLTDRILTSKISFMKIKMNKNVVVEVKKRNDDTEIWTKELKKWDVLEIDLITPTGDNRTAHLTDYHGDVYLFVPVTSFDAVLMVK